MKSLIAYGTKHGTTAKCAKLLQAKLTGETVLVNLTEQASPDLAGFDQIIMGGSIYAGQINKQVRKFCERYLAELTDKKPVFLSVREWKKSGLQIQITHSRNF